jgi:hypothetical protein
MAEGLEGFGTANGNRTRILALKGLRANRCTIAALFDELQSFNYTGSALILPCIQCYSTKIGWPLVVFSSVTSHYFRSSHSSCQAV